MSSRRRKSRRQQQEDTDTDDMAAVEETIDEMEEDEKPVVAASNVDISARMASEEERLRDVSLLEFLDQMDDYQPVIPDAVLDYYLTKSGFDCPDIRIKRMMALAAQKFVSDIAQDAFQYYKIRQQGMSAREKKASDSKKAVLTMEDLAPALAEYGINVKKPEYYL